jgi:hypothetical protein
MTGDSTERRVVEQLREIVRLAGEVATAGGPDDRLGVRNRAVEIAAQAETLIWVVDPDSSEWCLELYRQAREDG